MKFRMPILATMLLSASSFASAACEREDLKTTIDGYFAALVAHDTTAVKLSDDLKFTENGYELKIGEGFWQTAGDIVFSRNVLDTESCSTVTQAVIKEGDENIQFGVRLKLNEANDIAEIEHIIARSTEFAANPQGVLDTSYQDWETPLQNRQRTSRMAMRAAANDYFDMFADDADVNAPFAFPCHRWENGTQTTRRLADCSPAGTGLVIIHGERRVPVVDRETGVAVAFVHFAGNLPDMHMFKFRAGKVELVQAVIGAGGAGTMGWPDDTTLTRRVPAEDEQMSAPLNLDEQ